MRNFGAESRALGLIVTLSLLVLIAGCKEDTKKVYQKAMKAYQAAEYQKAAKLFESLLQKTPEQNLTQRVRYELGNIYFYKLKQPYKALEYLQELYAQSQPGKYALESLKLMGDIYDHALNDCTKGIDIYRILLRDYASEIEAGKYQYALAECYFRLHDYEQALQEFQTLVTQYPGNASLARAKFQIANSHALQEHWQEAIQLYEELLRSQQALEQQLRIDITLELAFCYEQEEEFRKALDLYVQLQSVNLQQVVIDMALVGRKIKRVEELIEESEREPPAVQWKRKKG